MIVEDHASDARQVYDSAAADYVAFVGTELSDKTEDAVDRSILLAFVELATSSERRPIADLGCGPGRVSALLSRSGLDTIGVDVSPRLARLAHDAHPAIPFTGGQISALPLVDQCLGGAVCWYSIIYTPPERLGRTFNEISRVVVPGGPVLLAFQAGPAEPMRRSDAFGVRPPTHELPARSPSGRSEARGDGAHCPCDDASLTCARSRRHLSGVHSRSSPTAYLIAAISRPW